MRPYVRFLIVEPAFRLRLFSLLALCVLAIFLFKLVLLSDQGYHKVKTEHDLALKLSDLEKKIQANTIQTAATDAATVKKVEFVLEGTSIRDGVLTALIDDTVYTVGDSMGEYVVTEITKNSTTLEHRETKEIKKLEFNDEAILNAIAPLKP